MHTATANVRLTLLSLGERPSVARQNFLSPPWQTVKDDGCCNMLVQMISPMGKGSRNMGIWKVCVMRETGILFHPTIPRLYQEKKDSCAHDILGEEGKFSNFSSAGCV